MSEAKGQCEGCGKVRVLQKWSINQMATRRLCSRCIDEDRAKRSEAATGRAGPKPKRESQLETVDRRIWLTAAAAKKLDTWLAEHGFPGGGHKALKAWVMSL